MKITLTEALKELKTLDSRIQKAMFQSFIGTTRQNGVVSYPRTTKNSTELSAEVKANFQSVQDLMNRKSTIKSKLIEANNSTKVNINEVEMSIASAIDNKNNIQVSKLLVQQLKNQLANALTDKQNADNIINNKFEEVTSKMLDGKESKTKEEDFLVVRKQFEGQFQLSLVDPIGVEDKIKELEENIEVFESTVDVVLSIANATTYIEL